MNFLAHSLLGFNNPALVTGQFCGDFVRGSQLSHFPLMVERGIRLHRHLDSYTDTYTGFQAVRAGMKDVPRRFSGIVIDVLFDHYLAEHWPLYSAKTLDEHAENVHASLLEYHDVLPEPLQRFLMVMQREGILQNNNKLASIELTLARISQRSHRFNVLALSQNQLEPLRDQLHEPFGAFYPLLHAAAQSYLDSHGEQR